MSDHPAHTAETDPVNDEESILRRILKDPEYYKPALPMSVTGEAFRPNKNDTKGLSLYRCAFVAACTVAEKGKNKKGYAVAELSVRAIREKEMMVEPDALDRNDPDYLPGHVAIPQINIIGYANADTKKKMKELSVELALIASKKIVYGA